jgi:hypothetical protein
LSRIIIEGERLKEIVAKLEDARRSMDELIDTLEMLQDEEFQMELKESLSEAEKGEILSFGSVNELERALERSTESSNHEQ